MLLYDPAGQDGWAGPLRIIVYIRADLEPEIAADPLIGQVGWSWLTEALGNRTAGYAEPSGTVTRVVTEGFGAKETEPAVTGFELRASWSPLARRPGLVPGSPGLPRAGGEPAGRAPGRVVRCAVRRGRAAPADAGRDRAAASLAPGGPGDRRPGPGRRQPGSRAARRPGGAACRGRGASHGRSVAAGPVAEGPAAEGRPSRRPCRCWSHGMGCHRWW